MARKHMDIFVFHKLNNYCSVSCSYTENGSDEFIKDTDTVLRIIDESENKNKL